MPIHHRIVEYIGRLFGLVILVPHPIAIGNFCEEIYFGMLKARREKKKLLLLIPYQLPGHLRINMHGNREALGLRSPFLSSLHSGLFHGLLCWLVTLYFGFFRAVGIVSNSLFRIQLPEEYVIPMLGQETLWQPSGKTTQFSWAVVDSFNWGEQTELELPMEFSKNQLQKAQAMRRAIGLPEDAWFVCLHVRDGAYYGDASLTPSRNANIKNYLSSIEEITGRGGWVVRIGDRKMPKLPPMERVIDYPFTDAKSALMDMYLIKECRLYLGMISGTLDMAMLFHRPIIMTNMPNWLWSFPQKRKDLGIFRPVFSKLENRYIPPLEWPNLPWGDHNEFGPVGSYVYHENTAEEIRSVVVEHFERGESWTPTQMQTQFNKLRIARGHELISKTMVPNRPYADAMYRFRFGARLESAGGVLGAEFLNGSSSPRAPSGRPS